MTFGYVKQPDASVVHVSAGTIYDTGTNIDWTRDWTEEYEYVVLSIHSFLFRLSNAQSLSCRTRFSELRARDGRSGGLSSADTLGVLVDMDTHSLYYFKNGVCEGTVHTPFSALLSFTFRSIFSLFRSFIA